MSEMGYVRDGLCVMIKLATTTLTHQVSCVVFVKLEAGGGEEVYLEGV
jgi:hypothetical protein